MGSYNSYVGKIAGNLQSSNMQRHMSELSGDLSKERKKFLQHLIDYEYRGFISLIYETAFGVNEKYYDGEILRNCLEENERDLVPIFTKMNEDCLNDPEFSKALMEHKLYAKNIGYDKDSVLFYPPGKVGSVSNDISMDMLYIPSSSVDEPNVFRLEIKEQLNGISNHPYISYSVDIGDDGSIKCNDPIKVEKVKKDDKTIIVTTNANMSDTHVKISEGIVNVRDVLMDLFEKAGIKEVSKNK